ncbi:MAG: hypothetical protein WBN09_14915 [Woeseiaceae bacterium]
MNILIAAGIAFIAIALLLLYSMLRHLKRGRMMRASGSFAGGVTSASLGGASALLAISYLGYGQLTAEQRIGLIEFTALQQSEYSARLMLDGEIDQFYDLSGDEWQLDARLVSWKPPATILGLEPIYQLERLSGRYTDILRERSEPRTVHALFEERVFDLWTVARQFPLLMPGVDAYYGSATYLPMADGARYEISISRDAIIARPINDIARQSVGEWRQPQQ